jgi:hypothetical protein
VKHKPFSTILVDGNLQFSLFFLTVATVNIVLNSKLAIISALFSSFLIIAQLFLKGYYITLVTSDKLIFIIIKRLKISKYTILRSQILDIQYVDDHTNISCRDLSYCILLPFYIKGLNKFKLRNI